MNKPICWHGRQVELPEMVYIGVQHNQWPLRAFESAESGAHWLAENPEERHVYRLKGILIAELMHVPPVPASYQEQELAETP